MALTAWRCQQQVVGWNQLPLRLVQILANVLCAGVVGGMPFHGFRPMVCGPYNLHPGLLGTCAPATEAGEQVSCFCHAVLA